MGEVCEGREGRGEVVGGLTLALGLLTLLEFRLFSFFPFVFRTRKKKREKRKVGRDIAGPGYLPFAKARKFKMEKGRESRPAHIFCKHP